MKVLYKYSVGMVALVAGGLTAWPLATNRLAVSQAAEGAPAQAAPAQAEGTSAQAAPPPALAEAPAPAVAAESARAADVAEPAAPDSAAAVPADLRVSVRRTPSGPVISVRRPGHVIAVKQGRERRVGMNQVEWAPKARETAPLAWETTHARTLETVRGALSWSGGDEVAVESAAVPAVTASEAAASHVCRAHGDGAGGFVVVCRVDGAAAAAAVEGDDPRRGVWSQAGDRTIVRFDIPMEGDGVDTRVLGYEKGGRGVLVRVEASRAPGETAPLLAIQSDSRAQPQAVRRIGCFCRIPFDPSL